ncbi:MAG: NUDIX hydrolase [Owenweeksia sp.]|nr:NUDIX hydrolase [Owenweeksia sp.]
MKITETEVTVDLVVEYKERILLIKRGNPPQQGSWALPGGFVETDETVVAAAARELQEETGLATPGESLHFIGYFDDPQRDPRGRVISFAFGVELSEDFQPKAGDNANAVSWVPLYKLPGLAFDHEEILKTWKLNKLGGG